MDKKFLSLDGLEAYNQKLMSYIDARFGVLEKDLDEVKEKLEEEKEDIQSYYYPFGGGDNNE